MSKKIAISDNEKRALKIINDFKPDYSFLYFTARDFAYSFWPNKHFSKPHLVGGNYLGKLVKKGWVFKTPKSKFRHYVGYALTPEGREALKG